MAAAAAGTPNNPLLQPDLLNSGQICVVFFFMGFITHGCDFKHNLIHQSAVVRLDLEGSGRCEVFSGILLPSSVLLSNCMQGVEI